MASPHACRFCRCVTCPFLDRPSQPPLLTGVSLIQLEPVRHCFHRFLDDTTAARLLRTSRVIAHSLLDSYAFEHHVFTFPYTVAMKRSLDLYSSYKLRVQRLCLPAATRGEAQPFELPASLTALALGPVQRWANEQHSYMLLDGCDPLRCVAHDQAKNARGAHSSHDDEAALAWRMRRMELTRCTWELYDFGLCEGQFSGLLNPGRLPHGLRFLQLNDSYTQPLRVGSIPDTVQVLQLGRDYNHPMSAGHLPSSLEYLVLGDAYDQPLSAGVLPASLRYLRFGQSYKWDLAPGALPLQLEQLSLGYQFNRPLVPGAIPPCVTHLRLSLSINQPLIHGSIPHGVTHLSL